MTPEQREAFCDYVEECVRSATFAYLSREAQGAIDQTFKFLRAQLEGRMEAPERLTHVTGENFSGYVTTADLLGARDQQQHIPPAPRTMTGHICAWIKCSERMPAHHGPVLVACAGVRSNYVVREAWFNGGWLYPHGVQMLPEPTHWMLLPEPPT